MSVSDLVVMDQWQLAPGTRRKRRRGAQWSDSRIGSAGCRVRAVRPQGRLGAVLLPSRPVDMPVPRHALHLRIEAAEKPTVGSTSRSPVKAVAVAPASSGVSTGGGVQAIGLRGRVAVGARPFSDLRRVGLRQTGDRARPDQGRIVEGNTNQCTDEAHSDLVGAARCGGTVTRLPDGRTLSEGPRTDAQDRP